MSYLAERFQAAVTVLVGDGAIKERLAAAYVENLDDLEDTEFPATLRQAFSDLELALHAEHPIGREPCVRATVRKMSSNEARAHANTIVMLYAELVRHSDRAEPLRVVPSGRKKPPKFLSEGG
ncbi:MAG: hypothetical protein OEQ25_05540 [Gammaproteobacteria bacterium]|nr:hypothetical protein [Gammaproteobacteria bacterium]MDH3506589.1 hypothetical protein [Gammaproteobacteria bacterium]